MRIYVDHTTGTWGDVRDLHIIEAPDDLTGYLAELSDSERIEWAEEVGGITFEGEST